MTRWGSERNGVIRRVFETNLTPKRKTRSIFAGRFASELELQAEPFSVVVQSVGQGPLRARDFLDDYRVDPNLRNDLGLLFLVDLEPDGPRRIEAVSIRLEFAYTWLARGDEAAWITRRFPEACAEFSTEVFDENGRLALLVSNP